MNVKEADKLITENERLKKELEELENKVHIAKSNLKDPLYSLSVEDFVKILETVLQRTINPAPIKERDFTDKRYVYGIAGIATLFNCCKTTASRILHSGKIDKAVTKFGQKIIVDADLAMQLNRQ